MSEVFCVCFTAASLLTLLCTLLGPLIGLSFSKEGIVPVQVSSLRDRSSPLKEVILNIQVSEDEMMLQSMSLF